MNNDLNAAQQGVLDCQQGYPYGTPPPRTGLYLKGCWSGSWHVYTASGGSVSTGIIEPTEVDLIDKLERANFFNGNSGIVWGEQVATERGE